MISLYNEIKNFRNSVKNVSIQSHGSVLPNVYKTVFENGAYSIVNYTSEDVIVDGVTVKAKGYYMKGAE